MTLSTDHSSLKVAALMALLWLTLSVLMGRFTDDTVAAAAAGFILLFIVLPPVAFIGGLLESLFYQIIRR
ncbi:MAG: hypothetical protein Q9M25_00900 [Mariprofundaceae bacterium]|nr:hypothetical protein [Mariprofundaceae bacterium]